MVALGKKDIEHLINTMSLVRNFKSLEEQLTANGMDFRLAGLIEVIEAGEIGLSKRDNKPPVFGNAYIMEGYRDVLNNLDVKSKSILKEGEKVALNGLKPYLVVTAEEVNTPKDIMMKIEIRSSLFRYAQLLLETAFVEAGYKGRLTFMLLPILNTKIALGSRICQISFIRLSSEGNYEEQKEFSYQGGKVI